MAYQRGNGHHGRNGYYQGHDELRRREHYQSRYAKDLAMDPIGEFVVRRVIPALQQNSDRPVTLFMNFGTLHVQDDYPHSDGVNHAVIYNAPGCTMVLGSGQQSSARYGASQMVDVAGGPSGNLYTTAPLRGCSRCGMRRVLCFSGLCRDCEAVEMGWKTDRSIMGRRDDMSFAGYPERRIFGNLPSRW